MIKKIRDLINKDVNIERLRNWESLNIKLYRKWDRHYEKWKKIVEIEKTIYLIS